MFETVLDCATLDRGHALRLTCIVAVINPRLGLCAHTACCSSCEPAAVSRLQAALLITSVCANRSPRRWSLSEFAMNARPAM
jgi:hypothetical protein